MSQENVEIVREIYADPRGLIGTASERAAPDVEFDFTDVYPDRPVLKGVEEMRRFRDAGRVEVEISPAHEFTIRDGLIVRFKAYGDRKQALEAAGLPE